MKDSSMVPSAVVVKPFNTLTRRFKVTTPPTVVATEDVAPLDFDHLRSRKFLAVETVEPAALPSPAAPARGRSSEG